MKGIVLSIILPVYNVEKYIPNCLESLIDNLYDNYEIIIINDGTQDKSIEKCREYRKHYNNIKIVEQNNQGLSAARNTGLDNATGEYVTFIDSDDWVDRNYLDIIFSVIKEKPDIVVFGYYNDNMNTQNIIEYNLPENYYADYAVGKAVLCLDKKGYYLNFAWNKVYRNSLIRNIRFISGLSYCEDIVFNSKIFQYASSVALSSKKYYHYRSTQDSLTNNRFYNNYYYLAELAINAREELYRNLEILESGKELLAYKTMEYKLGELTNLYREKSNHTFSTRKMVIIDSKKYFKANNESISFNTIQKLVYRIVRYLPIIVADSCIRCMFVLKNNFKGLYYRIRGKK